MAIKLAGRFEDKNDVVDSLKSSSPDQFILGQLGARNKSNTSLFSLNPKDFEWIESFSDISLWEKELKQRNTHKYSDLRYFLIKGIYEQAVPKDIFIFAKLINSL